MGDETCCILLRTGCSLWCRFLSPYITFLSAKLPDDDHRQIKGRNCGSIFRADSVFSSGTYIFSNNVGKKQGPLEPQN